MAKVSRPIIYTALGAVVVAAIVFLQPSDQAPAHKKAKVTKTADAANGILPEDLNAHFDRYAAKPRDVFAPAIAPPKLAVVKKTDPGIFKGQQGTWSLTGINTVNGVTSALVENAAADDSVFLKVGDTWHGLRVLRVGGDAIVFQNALGQQTKLAFVTNDDNPLGGGKTGAGTRGSAPSSPYALPLAARGLAPMPIRPLPPLQSSNIVERSSN